MDASSPRIFLPLVASIFDAILTICLLSSLHFPPSWHLIPFVIGVVLCGAVIRCRCSSFDTLPRGVALLIVALIGLLRGGVLGTLLLLFPGGTVPCVIVATFVSWTCIVAAFRFVLSPWTSLTVVEHWERLAILGVVWSVLFRLSFLALPELLPEEAYYWLYARHLDLAYLDHPPMVSWLIAAGCAVFGHDEFGIRIGALFCWCLGAFPVYGLAKATTARPAPAITLLLYSVLPYFFTSGILISPDGPLIAAVAGVCLAVERATTLRSSRWWLVAGACLGLGMLSKYTIALSGVATVLYCLVRKDLRKTFLSPAPYVAVLLSLLVFSPVLEWNATHQWASFLFQSSRRIASSVHFSLHELILNAMILVAPPALFVAWREVLGALKGNSERLRPALFFAVPFGVFACYSLRHVPKLNWCGPSFIVLLPLMAVAVTEASHAERRFWRFCIATLPLLAAIVIHYFSISLPGLLYSSKMRRFVGWNGLATQIASIGRDIEEREGAPPLLSGMDKHNISAELAFYTRGQTRLGRDFPVTGRHLFGDNSLMFEYWSPTKEAEGKTILLVARDRDDLAPQKLGTFFTSLSEPAAVESSRSGQQITTYFYAVGRGFRAPTAPSGSPPRDADADKDG